jgi:hypothetical protein
MTASSANLTGTGFTSGLVNQLISVAGAGRGGAKLYTYIKTFNSSTSVTLGHSALTTVSSGTYQYYAVSNAWQANMQVGSGAYNRSSSDITVTGNSLYTSDTGAQAGGLGIGYATAYNNNAVVTGNYVVAGAGACGYNYWRSLTATGNTCISWYYPGLSGNFSQNLLADSPVTFISQADYPINTIVRPTVTDGNFYRVTVAGTAATTEPTWSTSAGATTTSGSATFVAPTVRVNSTAYAAESLIKVSSTVYRAVVGGTSAGSAPSFTSTVSATTADGSVVWQSLGTGASVEIKPYTGTYTVNNNTFRSTNPLSSGFVRPFRTSGIVNEFASTTLTFTQHQTSGLDASSTYTDGAPASNVINYYPQDPLKGGVTGRMNVAVYNWTNANNVTVDLSTSGLVQDQPFEIRDAECLLDQTCIVASGTYGTGGSNVTSVSVAMNRTTITKPLGYTYDFPSNKPTFGAFVVLPGDVPSGGGSTIPLPASLLVATQTGVGTTYANSIGLVWADNSSDETGFKIYRSTSPDTGFTLLTTTAANATSYTDSTTTAATTYYYYVVATNAVGDAAPSNISGATTTRVYKYS